VIIIERIGEGARIASISPTTVVSVKIYSYVEHTLLTYIYVMLLCYISYESDEK
jgi:hypothetical protein